MNLLALRARSVYGRAVLSFEHSSVQAVEELMRRLALGPDGDSPALADHIVAEHLATGGKRLRARLALSAAQALDFDPERAVGWGAACELLHNATLIHDDIQDGDRVRRGEPTAWVRHGIPQAINAGDILFVLPFSAVETLDVSPEIRTHLHRILAERSAGVIRGQSTELDLNGKLELDIHAYLTAIEGKTSALFQLPVEGAAVLGGMPPGGAAVVSGAFRLLGMLFQLQDDVVDLFGDKGREAPGSDLREGKVSGLVVEHAAAHPEEREWLVSLLQKPREETTQNEVNEAIERFRQGGALKRTTDRIRDLHAQARDNLQVEPRLRELLDDLVEVILEPIAHVM